MEITETITCTVLLADDDYYFGKILKRYLEEKAGTKVYHALDGDDAWLLFNEKSFDICLLDIVMPGLNGFELIRKIRAINKDVPVIFITSRFLVEDKIEGFNAGGDDYLVKPFSVEELWLRMNYCLRRSREQKEATGTTHHIGDYILDLERLTLTKNDICYHLTPFEVKTLILLVKKKGEIVEREDILKEVWELTDGLLAGRSLDVFITKLRKYFKDDPNVIIQAVREKGYRLKVFKGIK